jgi:glutamate synthase domain-containing protein 3
MVGDVIGYGMRGGKIYIQGDVGYRVAIHMKGYLDKVPVMVIGGKAGDFFGEYMAGGVVVLLGATSNDSKPIVGDYCASGMHGGVIYIREDVEDRLLGKEVKKFPLDKNDEKLLRPILTEFLSDLDLTLDIFDFSRYIKLIPVSSRPYGRMYVY